MFEKTTKFLYSKTTYMYDGPRPETKSDKFIAVWKTEAKLNSLIVIFVTIVRCVTDPYNFLFVHILLTRHLHTL